MKTMVLFKSIMGSYYEELGFTCFNFTLLKNVSQDWVSILNSV